MTTTKTIRSFGHIAQHWDCSHAAYLLACRAPAGPAADDAAAKDDDDDDDPKVLGAAALPPTVAPLLDGVTR
jgi:hypothetical protein